MALQGTGIIYAVNGAGNLYFYQDLARNGTPSWANSGNGQQIGNGWNFAHVFSGGDGIIYAVNGTGLQNGNLIGSSGLNGGASGWEIDVAEGPGQVSNVQVLARGTNGADMTYYETASGGFVFSVGSLSFGGSLAVDPALQKIVRNVLNECV